MSQAKVDRYKKEKKDREKNLKKKRVKKYIGVIVAALIIGACIGYPLGRKLYRVNAERREANETVSTAYYNIYLQNYWNANYAGTLGFPDEATSTDADFDDVIDIDESVDNIDGDTPTDAE